MTAGSTGPSPTPCLAHRCRATASAVLAPRCGVRTWAIRAGTSIPGLASLPAEDNTQGIARDQTRASGAEGAAGRTASQTRDEAEDFRDRSRRGHLPQRPVRLVALEGRGDGRQRALAQAGREPVQPSPRLGLRRFAVDADEGVEVERGQARPGRAAVEGQRAPSAVPAPDPRSRGRSGASERTPTGVSSVRRTTSRTRCALSRGSSAWGRAIA